MPSLCRVILFFIVPAFQPVLFYAAPYIMVPCTVSTRYLALACPLGVSPLIALKIEWI